MTRPFYPQRVTAYPMGWVSAVRAAAVTPEVWVTCDSAPTPRSARKRMERLRAFRDGLLQWPLDVREATAMQEAGYRLAFRRIEGFEPRTQQSVWHVQLSWQEVRISVEAALREL